MIPVIMPRQGQSVESCIITKWHKKPGDPVAPGDLLFSYETDKAAFDEEAKDGGTLLAILREAGDDVPCLETVCIVGAAGEDVSSMAGISSPSARPREAAVAPVQARPIAATLIGSPASTQSGAISPRARALAAQSGADLSLVQASGPKGRVIARDVAALIDAGKVITPAARGLVCPGEEGTGLGGRASLRDIHGVVAQAPTAPVVAAPVAQAVSTENPDVWVEPLPNIRKRIAKAMQESLSTMAQLTHSATYDATGILALRKQFKEQGKPYGMEGVTLGDMIVYAVSRTLMQPEHAVLNAHLIGDALHYFRHVQLGIAVDTPRGLMVPILRNAGQKTLLEISNETKALAAACQSGAIDPDLLTGGSFTVSNLGALEVEHFTPVINPPQTGILGVNTIQQRVRERNGQVEVYSAMSLSLTYDHRALDGAPASRFLRDIKRNLENFQMLLGGGAFHV